MAYSRREPPKPAIAGAPLHDTPVTVAILIANRYDGTIREMIAKVADETQPIDDALSAWLYEHDGVTDQDVVDIADSIHEHLSSAVEPAATLE